MTVLNKVYTHMIGYYAGDPKQIQLFAKVRRICAAMFGREGSEER